MKQRQQPKNNMKILNQIIGSSIAIAAALAISAPTIQAQVLVNPGFEDPLLPDPGVDQGWAAFGTAARVPAGPILPLLPLVAHSGNYSLLAQNAPGSDWNPAGVEQVDSGAIAGETYTFSIWYLTDTGVTYATPVGLEIGFLNSAMVNIGTVEGGGSNSGGFNYNIPSNNTWYQGGVTGTAPAGSVYLVVYAMFMDNGQTAVEDVYFDDASLSNVPEPSSFALLGMGLAIPFWFIRRRNNYFVILG